MSSRHSRHFQPDRPGYEWPPIKRSPFIPGRGAVDFLSKFFCRRSISSDEWEPRRSEHLELGATSRGPTGRLLFAFRKHSEAQVSD